MLTLWYEKCGKYYSSSPIGIQASEEEKRLTMTLFTRIFDALARRVKYMRKKFLKFLLYMNIFNFHKDLQPRAV